jgi:hypothetical protein
MFNPELSRREIRQQIADARLALRQAQDRGDHSGVRLIGRRIEALRAMLKAARGIG